MAAKPTGAEVALALRASVDFALVGEDVGLEVVGVGARRVAVGGMAVSVGTGLMMITGVELSELGLGRAFPMSPLQEQAEVASHRVSNTPNRISRRPIRVFIGPFQNLV
jgi:hypothetical protein